MRTAKVGGLPIRITPPARMVLEQLSAVDRRRVRAALKRLGEDGGRSATLISPAREGRKPYYMIRASEDFRLLFERSDTSIDIIDIATSAQLSFFQRATA